MFELKYNTQKKDAAQREIEFLLTFEEWLQIWLNSGKLPERGRGKDKYCMARFGDTGPYAVDNVRIITNTENQHEAHLGRKNSPETIAKLSASLRGHSCSEETRAKISAAALGNKKWLGKKHSAESRLKISLAAKGHKRCVGRIMSPETRLKISLTKKKKKLGLDVDLNKDEGVIHTNGKMH